MSLDRDQYARARGFEPEEWDRFGIRAAGNHIIIPTLGRGGVWYERVHRPNGQPRYETPAGEEAHLYNPQGLGPHSPQIWIAEGEFDCLSLVCAGVPAVAVLGAGAFNRHWQLLFAGAEIVIAFDPDQAGRSHAEKLAQLWPSGQVSFFDPSPHGDLNEWFAADRAGFTEAVNSW